MGRKGTDRSLKDAEEWRQQAANKVNGAHKTFLDKRQNVVRAVWPNDGSPDAETMWKEAGGISPSTVKGKRLHAALKTIVKAAGLDDTLLNAFAIPSDYTVAPELKIIIEEAVASDPSAKR